MFHSSWFGRVTRSLKLRGEIYLFGERVDTVDTKLRTRTLVTSIPSVPPPPPRPAASSTAPPLMFQVLCFGETKNFSSRRPGSRQQAGPGPHINQDRPDWIMEWWLLDTEPEKVISPSSIYLQFWPIHQYWWDFADFVAKCPNSAGEIVLF